MKDIESFSAWMEEGLREGVIEEGAEKCLMAFVLPDGGVRLGYWEMEKDDIVRVSDELVLEIRDRIVLEAMEELKAEQEEECGWFEE